MKNQFKITLFALGALALGACTDNDVVSTDNAGGSVAIGGDGYVSLAINLPTTPATRANDNFDDGLPSEYAVHDAYLLLFSGDDEANATYYANYALTTGFDMYGTDNDNITSRSQITQQIDTPASGFLYALVILNNNGLLSNISDGITFSNLQTTIQALANGVGSMTADGFFMCNAPLTSTPGGSYVPEGSGVTTLAYIDPTKIFHTAEEAAENLAAEIYVERGMAKVTVNAIDSYTSSVELGEGNTLTVTVDGFALDQTNNVTFLVRNTTGNEDWWEYANTESRNYRMAGSALVGSGLYRTYWATDPNYDEVPSMGQMSTIVGATSAPYGAIGDEHPQYCLENTFSVAHQNDDETTRAIIQTTFSTADAEGKVADFYIWDKNHSVLYTYEGIQNLILNALEGNSDIEEAIHIYASETDFFTHFSVSLEEVTDGTIAEATDDATIVISITTPFTENDFKEPDTGLAGYTVPTVCTDAGLSSVVATLNSVHTIGAYARGVSYYAVLIKHFGDDLTPWSDTIMDASANDDNERSYPDGTTYGTTAEQAWLGRYGVLRNNWYDLTISSIAEPGSATPPEATGKPDDPTDLYISIEVNILSWAKRIQSVTL